MKKKKITTSSLRVSIFLAFKSLFRGNRGITVLTILMLAMIYVNLLFVPSVIQGITNKITLQLRETMTGDLVLTSSETKSDIKDLGSKENVVNNVESVDAAVGTYRIGTQVSYKNLSNNWSVDAIDPENYANVFKTPKNILEGKFLQADDSKDYIFLGVGIAGADVKSQSEYATSLKTVHVGDTVTVRLIDGSEHDFEVKGIYDNTFMYSNRYAFISRKTAEKIMPQISNRATTIYVKTDGSRDEKSIGDDIKDKVQNISYSTSEEIGAGIKEQISAFNVLYKIIEAFSLGVAAITVFIVTYVELINRRKQIGIERAIGIRPAAIVGVYLVKSVILTIIGTILGCTFFNLIFAPIVRYHPFDFPFGPVVLNIDNPEMWKYAIIMVVVSFVSALVPAIQSIRIKILDAIWGSN